MAPRGKRGDGSGSQAIHELGVRGRKTGVSLKDTGERDEYGMQPLEDLLSSPEKEPTPRGRIEEPEDDEYDEDSGSEDMDIVSSTGPGPRTLLKSRPSLQFPIPKSRSPAKTNLKSPARKNPHLERLSSPLRGSIVEDREPTVTRKLDFAGRGRGRVNGANRITHEEEEEEEEDDDDDDVAEELEEAYAQEEEEMDNMDLLEASIQMVNDLRGSSPPLRLDDTEEEEELVIQRSPPKKKGRGRPPKAAQKIVAEEPEEASPSEEEEEPEPEPEPEPEQEEPEEEEPPPEPHGRGRRKKAAQKKPPVSAAPSRKRRSDRGLVEEDDDAADNEAAEPEQVAPQSKRQRTRAPAPKPVSKAQATKPRGRPGRKPKTAEPSAEAGETSFAALQRGPPMPKSRGLVSVRRDADTVMQTRSGRHSYRPLDFWRGEAAVCEEEERDNMFARDRFVLPTIKEVVRVPEELPPSKRAPRSKARSKGKTGRRLAPEEELEEWELHPGVMSGEVVLWEPEHELQPPAEDEPVQITEEDIAVSADAIRTKDIKDATFRFAKTLTMPFMGAGVVDLPPGADKKPKNSRKMHLVFFVHYGKVLVTVNDAQFRITAGGMWFVPRGNYYSITNDYETPCRIFFSQGCEVTGQLAMDQSQNSMMALGY